MPEENPFDRASRALARRAGVPLLCWLTGVPEAAVKFRKPLDTKLTIPGLPERTGDVLWHVTREDRHGEPWATLIEFQSEPDGLMFGRLLVMLGLVWLQVKPEPLAGDRFDLLAVVVNLTGRGRASRRSAWAEGMGVSLDVCEWNVGDTEASGVLDLVGRGEAPRVLLAGIPLMKGGADPAIIARWLPLAEAEPDAEMRSDLALALVFAELAGCREKWAKALEGFNVHRSVVVDGWKAEGMTRAVRAVLEARFGGLPSDLAEKLGDERPLEKLDEWAALAARADSLQVFREKAGV
jgi:hypothetical protein